MRSAVIAVIVSSIISIGGAEAANHYLITSIHQINPRVVQQLRHNETFVFEVVPGSLGSPGLQGPPGKEGIQGKEGKEGKEGPSGERGNTGPVGEVGIKWRGPWKPEGYGENAVVFLEGKAWICVTETCFTNPATPKEQVWQILSE